MVPASETTPRTTVEPFRTGVESLVEKSFLEPVMATERSEMMFVLSSARDFCSLKEPSYFLPKLLVPIMVRDFPHALFPHANFIIFSSHIYC